MLVFHIVARYALTAVVTIAVSCVCAPPVHAADIDEQRQIFLQVFENVERGNWSVVTDLPADDQQQLKNYTLWPDLRAAYLRATISNADHEEVESFLAEHSVLKPARELRHRYALHLAATGDLAGYLAIYQQFYQGLGDADLDCLALRAEIDAGREKRVVKRATDLWTVGGSQVEECDPVFAFLTDNKLLGPVNYAQRFKLAVEAREFTLARWLAKLIDAEHVDIADQWLKAHRDPESFIRSHKRLQNDESDRQQLVYAIEQVTYDDPVTALALWTQLQKGQAFSARQDLLTARHIALWTARDGLPGGYQLLAALPHAAQNDEVLRWRARFSLRNRNWDNLLADIAGMSDDEGLSDKWRYWRGIALQRQGQAELATDVLTELATERSYYGFLAADEFDLDYPLTGDEVAPDESVIALLAERPELIRARELFLVGLDGRGRSEWDALVGYLTPEDKIQAAKLASRWGWHSRAISTAASAGDFDDLPLRYPLPYRQTFAQHSQSASISPTWAYGVARSESLFMRDVRSRAGAIGLMQLMPTTGRKVARQLRMPYSGISTLTDPDANIRLGTSYLGQMAERYGGNRVLATAAYNAGPHRVDRWLPDTGELDARIWIENIPFNETRKYVRRVMAAETIFHWRMNGETRRLSEALINISATPGAQRLASN